MNSYDTALKCLLIAGTYDKRLTGLTPQDTDLKTRSWAYQIGETNLNPDDLMAGTHKAYSKEFLPQNPIASIIAEARTIRRDRNRGKELTPPQPATNPRPVQEAYATNGAINLRCVTFKTETGLKQGCGAKQGEFCHTTQGRPKKIPCGARLARAELLTPRGKARYEKRQQELAEHRQKLAEKEKTK